MSSIYRSDFFSLESGNRFLSFFLFVFCVVDKVLAVLGREDYLTYVILSGISFFFYAMEAFSFCGDFIKLPHHSTSNAISEFNI